MPTSPTSISDVPTSPESDGVSTSVTPTSYTVHQIWLQGEEGLPDKYKGYVAKNRQLNRQYKLWDEKMIRNLVAAHYPEMLDTYDGYPYWVMRVDLAKYAILHHEGGMYSDMDLEPLQSYMPMMLASNGKPTFYLKKVPPQWEWARGPFINNNWFYAPTAGHDLFRQLMDYAKASAPRMFYDVKIYYILNSTGPQFMMEIIERYIKAGGLVTLYTEKVTDQFFKDKEAGTWIHSKLVDTHDKYMLGALAIFLILAVMAVRYQRAQNKK